MAMESLLGAAEAASTSIGLPFATRSVGGVCDGNTVAAEGIAALDSMGAVGGALHTAEEWIYIDSLVTRAQLSFALLVELIRRGSPPRRQQASHRKASL